jgi:hypothetical protein
MLLGESYSSIRALADFIRDITKYQHMPTPNDIPQDDQYL